MSSDKQKPSPQENSSEVREEYRILHKVAQILQTPGELKSMLQNAMRNLSATALGRLRANDQRDRTSAYPHQLL